MWRARTPLTFRSSVRTLQQFCLSGVKLACVRRASFWNVLTTEQEGTKGGVGLQQREGDGPGRLNSRPQDKLWKLPPEGKHLNVGKPPERRFRYLGETIE